MTGQLGGILMSLAVNAVRRTRRVAAASLIAVAALSLTACQDDGKGNATSDSSASAAASGGSGSGSGEGEGAGKGSAGGGSGASGGTGGDKQGAGSGQGSHAGAGVNGGLRSPGGQDGQDGAGGKSVDGTWIGVLKYLAPGKLTVTPDDGMEQAFFVATDTKVLGAAAICASNGNVTVDGTGYGTSTCTDAQLEKAAKMGSLTVRVTLQGGVATKVVEKYHP
ncbi:hypothetical protein AB0I22_16010 [Streptomyces sp. NPDC050610]|uniref:hypothetical protein n=1 Tax=Streptomyces sp. NPDC050610 TaxID=3157097 RepID=UPI00342AABE6